MTLAHVTPEFTVAAQKMKGNDLPPSSKERCDVPQRDANVCDVQFKSMRPW